MCQPLAKWIVPEEHQLFTAMTVYENLEIGATDQHAAACRTEHNIRLAISNYGYVPAEGKIELEESERKPIKDEHVRAAYLGL